MLPSGLVCTSNDDVRVNELGPGLYIVEDAYEGDYDFFAPSPLYATVRDSETEECRVAPVECHGK